VGYTRAASVSLKKKTHKVDWIIFCYRAIKLLFLFFLSSSPSERNNPRQKVFSPHNIICWNTWVTCITRGSFEFPIGFWYFKSNQVVSKSLLSSCKQSFSSGQLYKHHKKLTGSRCSQIWSEKKKIYLKKIPFNRRMDERCVWFSSISRDVTLFSYLKKLPLTSTKK
jgi:hypothetical protein